MTGSVAETIVVAIFMHAYWYQWETQMRVLMPILHRTSWAAWSTDDAVAFLAAQLHGARVAFKLTRKYRQAAREGDTTLPELPKLGAADTPADEKPDALTKNPTTV